MKSKVVYAMDLGVILKSLINVTAVLRRLNSSYMINPTFIINPLMYIYIYVHSNSIQVKSTPTEQSIHIYMGLSHNCNKILIGCFLIRILEGTSIMYASPMYKSILLYIIMTQLQSVMTAIHEYGIYETSPIIKNKILSYHNNIVLLYFMLTNTSNK